MVATGLIKPEMLGRALHYVFCLRGYGHVRSGNAIYVLRCYNTSVAGCALF